MAPVVGTSRLKRRDSVILDSMIHLVPPGHEAPLRQAFYTAAAILFTVAGCTAAIYVYYVLEIFIKPLMWALLCGSFLFPFKYSLNSTLGSWLKSHEETGRPLIVGAVLIPISVFDKFAETLGRFVKQKWKVLVALATVAGLFYLLYFIQLLHIFELAWLGIWQATLFVWNSTSVSVEFFSQYRVVLMTIVVVYAITALTMEPESTMWLRYAAVPAWISLLVCLVSVAGSMRVPLGLALLLLVITGAVTAIKQKIMQEDIRQTLIQSKKSLTALLGSASKISLKSEGNADEKDDVVDGISANTTDDGEQSAEKNGVKSSGKDGITDFDRPENFSETEVPYVNKISLKKNKSSESAIYFNLLFFAFVLTMAWMHTTVVVFLIIPLLYWCVKRVMYLEFVLNFLESRFQAWCGFNLEAARTKMISYCEARKKLLFPPSVRSVAEIVLKGDRKFNSAVLEALPTITTTIVILILIVGSISITFFFAVKIQQESFLLVQMTSDLINETVSKHPEYQSWLPDSEMMQKSMDSIVDNVYWQGREWIKDQLRSNFENEANVTLIEKQALKIWDRAYRLWFSKSAVSGKKVFRRRSTDNMLSPPDASSGLLSGIMDLLNMSEVMALLQENMSSLMSVLESVWSVVQTNLSLIFSSVTTVLTILLSGGSVVLNFVLSMVVFFTSLFYLLTASEQQYIPIQLIGMGSNPDAKPSPIATAIQDAISGVFGASLKMASFYALYTWLNHTAMGAALVYIPSLLATVFSVVPIFTNYWACIPAFLELWLLQGDLLRGLALVVFQFLPTMFVDGAIYSEMTESGGGHPYITGLAVAGGLYYFGLEGVIVGPILLCILLVAVNVYYRIINLPATELPHQSGATHQLLRGSTSDNTSDRLSSAT